MSAYDTIRNSNEIKIVKVTHLNIAKVIYDYREDKRC